MKMGYVQIVMLWVVYHVKLMTLPFVGTVLKDLSTFTVSVLVRMLRISITSWAYVVSAIFEDVGLVLLAVLLFVWSARKDCY